MTAHLVHSLLLAPSGKAALVAALAMALAFLFRKWMAPRWRHLLLMLVFVRLLVPDVGVWRWSAQSIVQRAEFKPSPPAEPASIAPVTGAAESAPPVLAPAAGLWKIGGAVWLAGVLLMLGIMLACSLRFHRRVLAKATPADAAWQQLVHELARARGWRGAPAVLVSPCLNSPVLAGLWHPLIILPANETLTTLTLDQRRHLLLHEMAHWRRGDLWLHSAASLLLALHWFNPVLWLARNRLRVESEAAADAWAVRQAGHGRAREYGTTLLQLVAPSVSIVGLLLPAVLGMGSGGRELRERLTELSWGQQRNRLWNLGALALIALAGAATFTRPQAAELHAEVIHLQHADPNDVAKSLRDILSPSAGQIEFVPDSIKRTLQVSCGPAEIAKVRALVKELDEQPSQPSFQKFTLHRIAAKQLLGLAKDVLKGDKTFYDIGGIAIVPPAKDAAGGPPDSAKAGNCLLVADEISNKLFVSGTSSDLRNVSRIIDRVEHPANLHGRVVDEQGKPIAGVQISRDLPLHAPKEFMLVMSTDVSGTFRFDDLVKGEPVKLRYSHHGYSAPKPTESIAGDPGELKVVLQTSREGSVK